MTSSEVYALAYPDNPAVNRILSTQNFELQFLDKITHINTRFS